VLETDENCERMSYGDYRMTSDGLYLAELCIAGPFEVLGRARDPNGGGWGRYIRFQDADKRLHQVLVKDANLHGDPRALAATLADHGLMISSKRRREFVEYFNGLQSDERLVVVKRTGWHELEGRLAFVLPDEAFGGPEEETFVLDDVQHSPYGSRGTLAEWQKSIGRLTAGHRMAVLAVSTAFAGPLLNIIGVDGGGYHLRGDSSIGKTSLMSAAASVYGPPTFIRPWRATANALEAIAELHTDTFLPLDEINAAIGKEVYAAAYQLSAGFGKGRAHRDGSARKSKEWRVSFLSTGEVSLAAKLAEERHLVKAGQEVRLLDIEADAGMGYGVFDSAGSGKNSATIADAIKSAATKFYGTAGPAFIKFLTKADDLVPIVTDLVEDFCAKASKLGTEGQIQRASRRLALIAAAGELAIKFGIVPWEPGSAEQAARFALERWISSRGGNEPAEVLTAISTVRLFIEKYGDSRFEDIVENHTQISDRIIIPNRAGWRRGKGEQQVWMVLPEVWKSEVCPGLDPKMVARVLHKRGILERGSEDELQKVHKIGGASRRAYTINASILAGLDTNSTSIAKTPVTSVTPVTKEFLEDTATGEKSNKPRPVTGVTGVTGPKYTNSEKHICAQCGAEDDQVALWRDGGEASWLHPECVRFWKAANDTGLDIPDFLDRRGDGNNSQTMGN
jgi:uncharacterized protein (DUF927 family)